LRGGVAEGGQGGVAGPLGYRRPGGGGQCPTPNKIFLQNLLDEAGVVKRHRPHSPGELHVTPGIRQLEYYNQELLLNISKGNPSSGNLEKKRVSLKKD
jgi:hypothetical protein